MALVAMSDYQDLDTTLEQGLLLPNDSTSIYDEIAPKKERGFNVSVTDVFGLVRTMFPHLMVRVYHG